MGLAVLLLTILATALPAAECGPGATVRVSGSVVLELGVMTEGALTNSNRDYVFADVPAVVRGRPYLVPRHKGPPTPFTVTVEGAGTLHLCLAEDRPGDAASMGTPGALGLPGAWTRAGTLRTEVNGLTYHWGLFLARVEAGQSFSVPAANRWGTVLIAGSVPGMTAKEARGPVADEFAVAQAQLRARSGWDQARLEAEALRPEALPRSTDRTPVDLLWRRTWALLRCLEDRGGGPELSGEARALAALEPRVQALQQTPVAPEADQRAVFAEVAAVRRRIAFRNPLLNFDRILFIKRHRALFNHMCDQFYGIAAQPGGGVFVLEGAFGPVPAVRDLVGGVPVVSGRLRGQSLHGGTPGGLSYDGMGRLTDKRQAPDGGAFLSPDLSFDGRQVLFAYVECRGDPTHRFPKTPEAGLWDPGRCFHLFRIGVDGTGLEQLTDGPWNDFDPCWLPDGRIAFVSDRRGGYLRCGRVCPTYTLYGMAADGRGLTCLSYHETHEWQPSVNADGMLAYTRWDYVDRDSDVAHHLWICYPDGHDPRSVHGNYPTRRELRPWMEMSVRAVPGTHSKYVATAAPHHGQAFGSLVLIDLSRHDDGAMSQVRRVTPEIPLPESEQAPGVPHPKGTHRPNAEVYGTAWPLSEDFYLCVYSPTAAIACLAPDAARGLRAAPYGIYLVDSFGNRDLLYADPGIGCSDPIPLTSRPLPPIIPNGSRLVPDLGVSGMGEVAVLNVYDSRRPWPGGTRIRELRVVNLFCKGTPAPDEPYIGHAAQSLARGVLGTVPVEEDGSAYFTMPAATPVYFQALDERGLAVQTMRSLTFVHRGERLVCVGCHESKHRAASAGGGNAVPLALRRAPSTLRPEAEGSYPLTFPRLVQPVLDRACVSCHQREAKAPSLLGDRFGANGWSEAFHTLRRKAWGMSGGNGTALTQRQVSVPGQDGALAAGLHALLATDHHGVRLDPAELRRVTLWLDCNSPFYGAYCETQRQARGEVILPDFGLPPVPDVTALVR